MMKTTVRASVRTNPLPATYAKLAAGHMPRPIRDKEDFDNVIEMMDKLAVLDESELTPDQMDYLETLSLLVEAWENENIPLPETSGIEVLRFLMEQHGMNAGDLGRLLGARTYGYALLKGDRQFSKRDMLRLGAHFNVNPGLFLG